MDNPGYSQAEQPNDGGSGTYNEPSDNNSDVQIEMTNTVGVQEEPEQHHGNGSSHSNGATDNNGATTNNQNGYQNNGATIEGHQNGSRPGSGGSTGNGSVHASRKRGSLDKRGEDPGDAHGHHCEPWRFTRWLIEYPRTVFFVTLGLHLFLMFILVILLLVGYPVLPIVFDSLPLEIRDNEDYLRGLAWQWRDEDNLIMERKATADIQSPRSQFHEKIDMYFEDSDGKNVFTKKKLQKMKDIEDDLFNIGKYQDDFCMLINGNCIKPYSVLRFFDGSYAFVDPAFQDPDFDDIVNVLYLASYYNETKTQLDYVLAEKAEISQTKAKSHVVRGYMSVGFPLDGYDEADEKVEKQESELSDFYDDTFTKKAEKHFKKAAAGLNFYYISPIITGNFILATVLRDIGLFLGSFTFIFLFMWFQTRSLFITFFGIMSVVNGFIITDILYICVLQYEYLGIFHVLSLFIVLGIGADDIFVFVDTWTESGFKSWPSVAHRMDHTYKHAAEAMLYTSLTTACAFFVSGASPFLAISSFGIFSGMLICINYISVIVHFPAIVAVYHLFFEKNKCCCCCPNPEVTVTKDNVDEPTVPASHEKGPIVRFLAGPYWKFISHRIIKFVVIGVFGCIIGVFLYFATTLEVNEEQIKFVSLDTNIGQAQEMTDEFGTGDTPQRVFLVWGLKNQDLDKCGSSDAECFGDSVFNNKFNLEDVSVQQDLMNFCEKIKRLDNSKIKDLKIRRNIVTDEPEVNCFMLKMQDFLEEDKTRSVYDPDTNTTGLRYAANTNLDLLINEDETRSVYNPDTNTTGLRYAANTNLDLPINQDNVTVIMDAVDYVYDTGLLSAGFSRYFEIAMSYWLYDGMQVSESSGQVELGPQYAYYSPLLGVSKEDYTVTFDDPNDIADFQYRYGTRLRYAAITVNLTVKPTTLAFPDGLPVRDEWEDFMTKEMKKMPSELKDGFQCTPTDYYGFDLWHWLYAQQNLARSAFQGVTIGLVLALPILIIATRNWIMGLLTTMVIALITMCVIGFIPMMGWKLGVLESLNLVLIVGLAVDYCVHLAEGYAHSPHHDRESRVRQTLENVGISVLSGAATTLGSSFFLMFAVLVFFFQFGIFMFATIGFSVAFSIVFFMALLAAIGPQGDTGSILPAIKWIKEHCCKCCRKSEESNYSLSSASA